MRIKKNRFIAILLIIIIVGIAYYVALTLAIDTANRETLKVMQNNYKDKNLVYNAVKSIDYAIFMKPWDKNLRANRRNMLMLLNDYKGALKAVQDDLKVDKNGITYEIEGLCYEYLGEEPKAMESYQKAQYIYEKELKEKPTDDFLIAESATLSMILGDTLRAQELIQMREIPNDSLMADFIERNNHLILNYKSGGLIYFYEKAKALN